MKFEGGDLNLKRLERRIDSIDEKHERSIIRLENNTSKRNDDINKKIDHYAESTHQFLMVINSTLGDVKGVLESIRSDVEGMKIFRENITKSIENDKKETERKISKLREQTTKISNKILYLIITLLFGGLTMVIGFIEGGE